MAETCLHIIHLPHRSDRWKLLQDELYKQCIANYQIWNGIFDKEMPRRGISRAHKQIIYWAKENSLPEICIAEDDCKFSAVGAFNYFINNKPNFFDLYLGGITWGNIRPDSTVTDFAGTMLYIANCNFYDTILSLPENEDYDRAMATLGKFVVCNPLVACQHDGYSDNQCRYLEFGPMIRRMKWFS